MLRRPLVRVDTAPTMRIVVDLPAPFGPSRPNDSPGATSNEMPSTALLVWEVLTRSAASRTGDGTGSTLGDPPDCCERRARTRQHPRGVRAFSQPEVA